MVIIKEDIDVEGKVGVGVWDTGRRGGEGDEEVARGALRGIFRDVAGSVSLSKPGE